MTNVFPYILPLLPIVAMMRSDICSRRIDVRWLVAFAVGTIAIGITENGLRETAIFSISNICILFMMLILMGVAYGFRCLFSHMFGIGDALFFAAVAPLFDNELYVIYLIGTFFCGILWWIVSRRDTIPLIGVAGLTFLIYIGIMLWTK